MTESKNLPKYVPITVYLPSDLLQELGFAISKRIVHCESCAVELALMRFLGLGRCRRLGILVHKDDHSCMFFKPKEAEG